MQPWICPVCGVGCAPTATHCTACEKRVWLAPFIPGTAPVIINPPWIVPLTPYTPPETGTPWPLPDLTPTVIYTVDTNPSIPSS